MTEPRSTRSDWLTLPNAITVARLLIVVPIGILLLRDVAPVWTAVLVALFGMSDWVDGFIARRLGQTSRVGELIDPIADRIGVVAIAVLLVISGHLPLWIALLIAGTDVLLFVFWLFHRNAKIPPVTMVGKVRTAAIMFGLALIVVGRIPESDVLMFIGVVLTGIGAVLHVLTGFGYARAILRSGPGA